MFHKFATVQSVQCKGKLFEIKASENGTNIFIFHFIYIFDKFKFESGKFKHETFTQNK